MNRSSILIPRSEWGAAPPKYPVTMTGSKDLFICHHSGAKGSWLTWAQEIAAMRFWQAYHQGPLMKGADIYYGAVVFPSGRAYEGREGGWWANNGGAYGCCVRGFGTCLAGDFTSEFPTIAALDTLVHLALEAKGVLAVPSDRHWGHRDCALCDSRNKGNECPGEMFYNWLQMLRKTVASGAMDKKEDDKVVDLTKQDAQENGQKEFAGKKVDVYQAYGKGSDYLHVRINVAPERPFMVFFNRDSDGASFGPVLISSRGFAGFVGRLVDWIKGVREADYGWLGVHILPEDSPAFRGFIRP